MSKLVLVNVVTGCRLLFALPVAVMVLWSRDQHWAIVASTALLIAIEVSDLIDGHLARRNNVVSPFGKLFDPYADSASRLIVYWSLAVIGRCLAVVPLVMAVRDVTVCYTRIIMTRQGIDASARHTGKLKALVQGTCGALLMAGPLYWGQWERTFVIGLSTAVMLITVLSMLDYGRAALRAL